MVNNLVEISSLLVEIGKNRGRVPRTFYCHESKYISSASIQLKSCISLPKSESPRYSPFTYKICVPHYHRTFALSILITTYNTLSLLIIIKAHHLSFSQGQAEPTLPILFRPIQIPVSSCLLLSFLQSDAVFLFH